MSTPSARILEADALHWIRERASDAEVSRYRLAREVCERFDWRDTRGRYQEMACRKRLGELHQRGLIVLPPKRRALAAGTPLSPREIVPIEAALSELGEIELLCVTTAPVALRDELSRIWRSLMQAHPLGGGPLCGAQLRYLIRCERGWLGALAFSAGAYRLNARDAWLGWDATERQANLERIVCSSRFLILPEVRVPHLASHVLAQIDKRLGADWQTRYGYTPWLIETFVDAPHTGVCYRAANWIEIGSTRRRGRNDAQHRHDRGRKKVFVKLLRPEHFPRRQAPPARADWAEAEFGGINLEPRLVRRSIEIARDFFARPSAQIPEACETWARTKAAYRFFDHPKAKMQTLLAGHYQATHQRCRAEPIVLAVCDCPRRRENGANLTI